MQFSKKSLVRVVGNNYYSMLFEPGAQSYFITFSSCFYYHYGCIGGNATQVFGLHDNFKRLARLGKCNIKTKGFCTDALPQQYRLFVCKYRYRIIIHYGIIVQGNFYSGICQVYYFLYIQFSICRYTFGSRDYNSCCNLLFRFRLWLGYRFRFCNVP